MEQYLNKVIQGDCLEVLKTLPPESIDMIITSPPYWALRDYGFEGQLGLEPTLEEYINKLCNIFDEVKRVLKKEGTCWVNLGDTYFGSGKGAGGDGSQKESWTWTEKEERICGNCGEPFMGRKFQNFCGSACSGVDNTPRSKKGKMSDKTLCQIPSRFAIEMTNRGWILRNEIIWHKPNAMPSSVRDRFTVDFEKLFFFTKNKKYYFEKQNEFNKSKEKKWGKFSNPKFNKIKGASTNSRDGMTPEEYAKKYEYRNVRSVWSINTKPSREAHFAMFPEKLIETPIKAGSPKNGIVLDIFMGSGTTALACKKANRNYLGIEINPEYVKIAEERIKSISNPLF